MKVGDDLQADGRAAGRREPYGEPRAGLRAGGEGCSGASYRRKPVSS